MIWMAKKPHLMKLIIIATFFLHCQLYDLYTGSWNARSATVLGQRGAWIFSTQDATHSDLTATTTGVSVSRISNGDVLDLNTYQITPAGEFIFFILLIRCIAVSTLRKVRRVI